MEIIKNKIFLPQSTSLLCIVLYVWATVTQEEFENASFNDMIFY